MSRLPAVAVSVLSSAIATALSAAPVHAEELGLIRVESTTIGDRFENKREEPSNIGVISGERVDRAHTENIQQLLQSVPGITTETGSGDYLKIHIRGVENQGYMGEKPGVAVVIDGVPVFERTGRVNIDLDNIESIKVVKGGASYLFGDDALAGAVIITTKRGAAYDGVKVALEAGSFDAYKGLARAGLAGENYNLHLQASRRDSDGYYDDSASRADYINGKAQYYLDDASDLTFGFEVSDRRKNSHGSVRGVTAAANDPQSANPAYNDYANHFDVELEKYFLTYSRDLGEAANLMVNLYQFTDATDFKSSPVTGTKDDYNSANDYDQTQRGLKAELRRGGERLGWMAGLDLRDNRYESRTSVLDCTGLWACAGVGSVTGDNRTDEAVTALYGELKFRVAEPLVVTLNGRGDRIELDYRDHLAATANAKSFATETWRIGANYAVADDLDLYTNASTGFRAPTVSQLFVGTNNPSMRTAPNADLRPEEARNLELGVRGRTTLLGQALDYDAALFRIDRKDFIQASGGLYSTGATNAWANVGDARHSGLELSLSGRPRERLSWDLGYTYLDASYTDYSGYHLTVADTNGFAPGGCPAGYANQTLSGRRSCFIVLDNGGNRIPRTSRHHLNLALDYRLDGRWSVTGELDAISSYFADESNQQRVAGHGVVNLLINYDREQGERQWNAFLRVDNLFDRRHYNTVRGTDDGNDDGVYDAEDLSIVVNQGRTLTAGLSVSF